MCRKAEQNIDKLYDYIKTVRFYNGITNLTVAFDALGDGIARYSISNYRKIAEHNFKYSQVIKIAENNFKYRRGTKQDNIIYYLAVGICYQSFHSL